MNRILAALGVVLALLLIGLGLWIALDPAPPAPGPIPRRPPPAPSPVEAPPVPVEPVRPPPGEADPTADEPASPDPGYTARIDGALSDAKNGQGVADVLVTLLHPTGSVIASTRSDSLGWYGFDGVPDLTPLVVRLEHPEYVTGLCCDLTAERERTVRKDVRLARAPELVVRLRLVPLDDPAAGANVRLLRGDEPVAAALADRDGVATLRVNALGDHELEISGPTFADPPRERITFGFEERIEIERTVHEGGSLRVHVRGADGEAAAGAEVVLEHAGLPPVRATTGADGRVLLERLHPATTWTVRARRADGLLVETSARVVDREVHDVALGFAPTGTIAGSVVTSAGHPVPGTDVVVRPVDAPSGRAIPLAADGRGRFRSTVVPPGTWTVQVPGAPPRASLEVVVTAGETTDAPLVLPADDGRSITGVLVDVDGAPLPAFDLRLGATSLATVTDSDGRFRFADVPPDQRHVVRSGDPDWVLENAVLGGTPAVRADPLRAVSIRLTATTNVFRDSETALRAATVTADVDAAAHFTRRATLHGTVRGVHSTPLGAVEVTCRGVRAFSGPDGRFELVDVPVLAADDEVAVRLGPPEGLYLPGLLVHDVPRSGPPREVRAVLRQRPFVVIHDSVVETLDRGAVRAGYFSVVPDRFLGAGAPPYAPIRGISYDGAWIHLPPPTLGSDAVSVGLVAAGRHGNALVLQRWLPGRERDLATSKSSPRTYRVSAEVWNAARRSTTLTLVQLLVHGPLKRSDDARSDAIQRAFASAKTHEVKLPSKSVGGRVRLDLDDLPAGRYRLVASASDGRTEDRQVEFDVPTARPVYLR